MLKMSFYHGTLNKTELKEFIKKTDKAIWYTYGLRFKNPTTKDMPITKEQALAIVDSESLLDATEKENHLDLNAYHSNDMW